ncbi:MAG: hypothetical protein IJP84_10855 [Lachnospiraceae bacterium]|nr:hypothetical protein [Lachnospiraceae bacterium]
MYPRKDQTSRSYRPFQPARLSVSGSASPKRSLKDSSAFIKFSLSVNNRRKSRAGLSLENHLEALFIPQVCF